MFNHHRSIRSYLPEESKEAFDLGVRIASEQFNVWKLESLIDWLYWVPELNCYGHAD